MNIIRPLRMITSAWLISLALLMLLVSATPIPSLDVASEANINALVIRDSIPSSQFQAPSVVEHFAHGQEGAADRLKKLTVQMIQISSNKGSHEDLVKAINEYANLIAHLTDADAKDIGDNVFLAIGYVKLFVAAWPSDEAQQRAIHGIKACEDKAVGKGLRRWVLLFRPPKNLEGLFDGRERDFKDTATSAQADDLYDLVFKIRSLTLMEYRSISKQLKKEYDAVEAKINSWQPGYTKTRAKESMKDWKATDSLVDVFGATEATAKV